MKRWSLYIAGFSFMMIAVIFFNSSFLTHFDQSISRVRMRHLAGFIGKEQIGKAMETSDHWDGPKMRTSPAPASLNNAHVKWDSDFQKQAIPMTDLAGFSAPVLAWIAFVMLVAGFAHGMIGFGFPIVATPLLTLALPMKQAILVSLLPTLVMTILNALRGGRLRESIGRYWYLPLPLMIGAFAGTRLLLVTPNEPFVLLLAAVLFLFLSMERLGRTNVRVVREHPLASALAFGLVAGVFEATANVSGPMLLVYFLIIGLNPRTLIQGLNFAFVAGKLAQTVTWTVSGGIGFAEWAQTLPWVLFAALTLAFGQRIHDRIGAETYMRWLRGFLWAMVMMLIVQFTRLMIERFA